MTEPTDEMLDDYGDVLKNGERGKYLEAALRAKGFVQLAPDLRELFPTAEKLDAVLRSWLQEHPATKA